MGAKFLRRVKSNLMAPQRRLMGFVLAYRWLSLIPAVWVFISGPDQVSLPVSSMPALAAALGLTLLLSLLQGARSYSTLESPAWLAVDISLMAFLLAATGAGSSPYTLHALSPLLAGAVSSSRLRALAGPGLLTALYFVSLAVARNAFALTVEPGRVVAQLTLLWLGTFLFGYPLSLYRTLRREQRALTSEYEDLAHRHNTLTAQHHQLSVTHELTLSLRGGPDRKMVQRRLLRAVTEEMGFGRAIVGLVNSGLHRLEDWQVYPPSGKRLAPAAPMPLEPENGLIACAVLKRQPFWYNDQEPLTTDGTLNTWLVEAKWLILPLVWGDQANGVLLLPVDTTAPVSLSDDRWPVLTSLASQAAASLDTIEHAQRLAVEQERNRIARDLHDTLAQSLFGIVFTLEACIKLLPEQAGLVKRELADLQTLADRVHNQVRQSILDIWPSELTQDKFKTDLRKYVAYHSPSHVFRVDFTIDGDFDGLPASVRRTLYRVCQEGLANAARHAGVDSARIYLGVEAEEVYLSIRDKGRGFDPKPVLSRERSRDRFGLRGICERIQALGGTCDILSQPGHGTQILVRVRLAGRSSNGRGPDTYSDSG
ncbi:MAG: GAF domain-containing sensor histidine kinase [Anaerolineae bacterium]